MKLLVLSGDCSITSTVIFVCHWVQTCRVRVREKCNFRNRGGAYLVWVWVSVRVERTYSSRGGHWVRVCSRV